MPETRFRLMCQVFQFQQSGNRPPVTWVCLTDDDVWRLQMEKKKTGCWETQYGGESMVEEKAIRLDVASQLRKNKEGRGRCKLGCPKQEGLSERI